MERQRLGRAVVKESSNSKPGLGWDQHPWGHRGHRAALWLSLEHRNHHSPLCLPILQLGTLLGPGWAVGEREGALAQAVREGKAKQDSGVAAASRCFLGAQKGIFLL